MKKRQPPGSPSSSPLQSGEFHHLHRWSSQFSASRSHSASATISQYFLHLPSLFLQNHTFHVCNVRPQSSTIFSLVFPNYFQDIQIKPETPISSPSLLFFLLQRGFQGSILYFSHHLFNSFIINSFTLSRLQPWMTPNVCLLCTYIHSDLHQRSANFFCNG